MVCILNMEFCDDEDKKKELECRMPIQIKISSSYKIKEQMNNLLRYNSVAVTRMSSHCIARSVSHANALCASSCVINGGYVCRHVSISLEAQSTLVESPRRCHVVVLAGIVCSLLYFYGRLWMARQSGTRCSLSALFSIAVCRQGGVFRL